MIIIIISSFVASSKIVIRMIIIGNGMPSDKIISLSIAKKY